MANSGLSRAAVDGNRKTFTFSFWVKRSKIAAESCLYYSRYNSNNHFLIRFTGDDKLEMVNRTSGSNDFFVTTNRKFKDVSAWYNIVVRVDTTQGTSGDRVRFYVNGEQETSFATQTIGSQNADLNVYFSSSTTLYFGQEYTSGSNFFEGYLSHVVLVDGSSLAPTEFGQTDSTSGIWKFKQPSGLTFGNNGVHLKFENSGNLGLDSSGQTHNYTVNGDLRQALDTPSNVYATLNPLFKQDHTFSNGNNGYTSSASDWDSAPSTLGASSGKWYCEMKITATASGTTRSVLGICDARDGNLVAESEFGLTSSISGDTVGYSNGTVHKNSSDAGGTFASFTTNDILGMYVDLDNGKVYFAKNGTIQNSGVPTSGSTGTGAISITTGQTYLFGATAYGGGASQMNFGNGYFGTTAITSAGSNGNGSLFEYDVPSGYYALNTKNINTYG